MDTLEAARLNMSVGAWHDFAKRSPLVKRWRYFLALDPYTRWGQFKPRGYAGDATLMDFAYGHPSILSEISASGPIGAQIYNQTSRAPQSASARQRIGLIAAEIDALASSENKHVIMSIASGHARELESIEECTRTKLSCFIAVDADAQSFVEAEKSAGKINFTGIRRNVIKSALSDLPTASLVYSLGLFDYLNENDAEAVLLKIWDQTKSGGKTIIANLSPAATNLGYCEAIMDWWMIPRSEESLQKLGASIATKRVNVSKINVERHGCFNYLKMEKS